MLFTAIREDNKFVSNNKKGSKTFKELEPKFITQFPFACFQFQ